MIWIAAVVGLLSGFLLAYWIARRLLPRMVAASDDTMLALWLALGGAIAMLLPAFFLSFVIGGTLGGALGERVSQPLGLGIAGVPYGLAAGIAVVFALILLTGAVVGIGIARLIIWWRARSAPEEPCQGPPC